MLKGDITLGLISDYLEECRERDWDPLLLQPGLFFYSSTHQPEIKYSKTQKKKAKHQTRTLYPKIPEKGKLSKADTKKELLRQVTELESMKHSYLLAEKNLLALLNSCEFQSKLAEDKLNRLLNNLKESYWIVCDLIARIYKTIGNANVFISFQSEDIIKDVLFDLIMDSFIYSLRKSDNAPFDTSALRKIIADMAAIIRYFQSSISEQQDKKIVYHFLLNQRGILQSQYQCQNCGRLLLQEIPYCLNCYERN